MGRRRETGPGSHQHLTALGPDGVTHQLTTEAAAAARLTRKQLVERGYKWRAITIISCPGRARDCPLSGARVEAQAG